MATFAEQAKRSLEVYIERGQRLIGLLRAGQGDAAERLARLRNAAFHNFAFYLEGAEASERDRSWVPMVHGLYSTAIGVNAEIDLELTKAKFQCQTELGECIRTRGRISKFRSQGVDEGSKVNTTA